MARKRSERSRWTTVYTVCEKGEDGGKSAQRQHDELYAIAQAFAKIGRVLRLEPSGYGKSIELKARRA